MGSVMEEGKKCFVYNWYFNCKTNFPSGIVLCDFVYYVSRLGANFLC